MTTHCIGTAAHGCGKRLDDIEITYLGGRCRRCEHEEYWKNVVEQTPLPPPTPAVDGGQGRTGEDIACSFAVMGAMLITVLACVGIVGGWIFLMQQIGIK